MFLDIVSIYNECYIDADPLATRVKNSSCIVSIVECLLKSVNQPLMSTDEVFEMLQKTKENDCSKKKKKGKGTKKSRVSKDGNILYIV